MVDVCGRGVIMCKMMMVMVEGLVYGIVVIVRYILFSRFGCRSSRGIPCVGVREVGSQQRGGERNVVFIVVSWEQQWGSIVVVKVT